MASSDNVGRCMPTGLPAFVASPPESDIDAFTATPCGSTSGSTAPLLFRFRVTIMMSSVIFTHGDDCVPHPSLQPVDSDRMY